MRTPIQRILPHLLLAGYFVTVAADARASVMSFATDLDFSGSGQTVSLFGASLTFSFLGADPNDATFTQDAVTSGGTALVNTDGGAPVPFGPGSPIGPDDYPDFSGVSAAPIAYSGADDFIGFSFTRPDGTHYGYVELNGPAVLSYGYETSPGADVTAGAVPEPAPMAVLTVALGGLAAARCRARGQTRS